jgi:hypothetical protein
MLHLNSNRSIDWPSANRYMEAYMVQMSKTTKHKLDSEAKEETALSGKRNKRSLPTDNESEDLSDTSGETSLPHRNQQDTYTIDRFCYRHRPDVINPNASHMPDGFVDEIDPQVRGLVGVG